MRTIGHVMNPPSCKLSSCSFLALLMAAACSSKPTWSEIASADLSPKQAAQKVAAETARQQLAGTLLGELSTALGKQGTAAAIRVCRDRAPAIASEVASRQRVRIGRTSLRLRNSDNTTPAWAAAHVAANIAAPALLVGPEGQLGALYPIPLMPQCVQCHGPEEQLSAEVKSALKADYPSDHATGFAPGDLRGWFWIEVPAAQ